MPDLLDAAPVRATALVDAGPGNTVIVLHREDQIFDLGRFNLQNVHRFRAVPTEHLRGLAWPEILESEDVRLDRGVVECRQVRLFGGVEEDPVLSPGLIRHTSTVDCFFDPCPNAASESFVDVDARINNTISTFIGRRLLARLDQTLEIPPLPAAAQRILALKTNPDYSLKELVKVVETDPSIAARVMSWACSAFYAASPPPKSLSDSIMRVLGFDLVMNMALGLALAGSLRLPAEHVRGAPPFWTEAVYTAAAMEALARRGDSEARAATGMSYLTGLLANYGTLVIGHVFPPQYALICQLQEANPHLPTWVLDEHVLKLSREVLAARLLDQWDLPESSTLAIRHQHTVDYQGEAEREVRLLQTARSLLGYTSAGLESAQDARLKPMGLATEDLEAVGSLLVESRDALDGLVRAVA